MRSSSSSSSLLLPLLLLLSSLSTLLVSVSGGYYAFCFTQTQSNQLSPGLGWSVGMSGTLQINDAASAQTLGIWSSYITYVSQNFGYAAQMGYPVVAATGTRTIYAQGTQQTLTITNISAPNAYNGNDNILALAPPYFDNVAHALTFTLSGQPMFAMGTIASYGNTMGNPGFASINNYTHPFNLGAGVQESDNPPHDGDVNVITSTFTLAPASTFSATVSCANTAQAPAYPAGAVAAFATQLTWSFCYTFTGGGWFATTNGQQWFIQGSGSLTTTGWAGTGAVSGRTGYLSTAISGTRTYTNPGTLSAAQTVSLVAVTGPNTQQAVDYAAQQFDWIYESTGGGLESDLGNNVFYPTYPYFDQWGINVVTSGTIGNEDATNLTTNAYRLWVDPGSYSFNEWVSDFYAGYWYFTYSAAAIFQPTSAISASALQAQCSPTYGSTVQLSWCYYIDGMATKQPFFSYAYGTATATGPAMRNGRMAYTLQTMNGVRSITNSTGVPGQYQTNSTAIIYLEYMQADLDLDFINNNLLYTTQPYVDQQGLIYATSNGPIFPNGAIAQSQYPYYGYTDVFFGSTMVGNNSAGAFYYEQDVLDYGYYTPYSGTGIVSNFNYVIGQVSPTSGVCQYSGSNQQYITRATTTTYSFCYLVQGADQGGWQTNTYGTITVYNTPIYNNGLLAYAVANITGTRTYQSPSGQFSSVTITGINSQGQGADGWIYDNLLYAQAPFFDSYGILYNFAGTAQSIGGTIVGDGVNVINIFSDTGYFQEEYYNGNLLTIYGDVVGTFNLVQDGGASGSSGSVLTAQCGYTPGTVFANQVSTLGFCYSIQNTLSTSPYLPWAVSVSGTLTVYSNSLSTGYYEQSIEYPGYLVVSGNATRTVWVQGKAAQTQQMSVVGVNAWNGNDNILQANNGLPGVYSYHGISFSTSTPYISATGTVSLAGGAQLGNVALVGWQSPAPSGSGVTEDGLPVNDGVSGTLTSQMLVNYAGSAPPSCTVTAPSVAAATASTYASTVQYSFCYFFTGWDHLGTDWTITTSGTLTASGYVGTVNGRQAVVVVGASGSRVMTFGNGTVLTTPIVGVGGFNSYEYVVENNPNDVRWSSYFSSNNLLYLSFPYFDSFGLSLQGSGQFYEPNGGGLQTGNTALKVFVDPATYDVAEWLLDWAQFTYYVGEAGSLQVAPSSSAASDFTSQCSAFYGALNTFQWCYWLDRSGNGGGPANPFAYYVQAYGTATARGPVTRQGQTAYTLQSMTGVRTFYNVSAGTSSSNPIIYLQYVNRDEGNGGGSGLTFWVTNDNVVFPSAPYLSESGFIYTTFPTPNNPAFGYGASAGTDVQVNVNQTLAVRNNVFTALQENSVGSESTATDIAATATLSTRYGFSMVQGGLSSTSACSAQSSSFKYPQLVSYSFCYVITGPANNGFTIVASGVVTTYNVQVTSTLQYTDTATIIAGISGFRQYTDGMGNNSYVTITGLGSNWFQEDGWDYDQLLYNNVNKFDSYGLLYTYSGTAMSPSGPVYGDANANVINIFNDGTGFQEEGWVGLFAAAYDWGGNYGNSTFDLQQDSGSSYSSGAQLRGQCAYAGAIPCGFGGGGSCSSSSSLSGGAIAGIVIGSVVGASLLCLLVVLACTCLAAGKSKSNRDAGVTKPSTSYVPQEESRVEHSQVELTGGETTNSVTLA